jgi:hypothetical protein
VATVNKNFRIKNGLVVEGSVATVNGQNILTEGGSDSYIVNLIGGQATSTNTANAVVKRDGSGNFSAGTITANLSGNVTGDVTGTVSSLSNHDTDDLSEGSTNLYFTDSRARAALSNGTGITYNSSTGEISVTANTYDAYGAASAAQNAAESYADGLAVNYDVAGSASTAQSNAETYADNLVNNLDTDDIEEGVTNKYFTNQRALDATSAAYDAAGSASTAQSNAQTFATNAINNLDTDDIEEGLSNLYFTNGRARNAVSGGTGITYNSADGIINVAANTYDAYGAASTAEGNAQSYTDNQINDLTTDDIEEGSSNKYFTDERAQDAVGNAVGNGLSYNDATGAISVDTTVISTKAYVDQEVAALVDSAPALLDTLNELAAAIGDDENFVTTVTGQIGEKVAKSGDTMTGALTLHADPTNALEAATKQYVDQAETDAVASANSYTDGAILAGNAVAEPVYAAIDFNGLAKNVAAKVTVPTMTTVTAYEWNHSGYTSGKFTVKVAAGTHTELSEILVTTDTSNNVHFTEYGMVGTNGSLSTISADFDTNKVRIRVTTLNNNSTVLVAGTLIGS